MMNLDKFLQNWILTNTSILPPKVIYSSVNSVGEGEHKIFLLMRQSQITGSHAHVLYGMDADLINLSMLAPLNKINLMREGHQ